MGNVVSSVLMYVLQAAWFCQRLIDQDYRQNHGSRLKPIMNIDEIDLDVFLSKCRSYYLAKTCGLDPKEPICQESNDLESYSDEQGLSEDNEWTTNSDGFLEVNEERWKKRRRNSGRKGKGFGRITCTSSEDEAFTFLNLSMDREISEALPRFNRRSSESDPDSWELILNAPKVLPRRQHRA